MVIQSSSGLSEAEIQRMIREAEQHAAEDARLREEAELKNQADNLAYSAEKLVRESGDRMPSDVKLEIENRAQSVRQAVERNDMTAVRREMEALQQAMQRAGDAMYATAGVPGGDGSSGGGQPTPEGTVEGEYREV
jgi:molecular chaperone DnaK